MLHSGSGKSEIQNHSHNEHWRAKNTQEDNRDDWDGKAFAEIADILKIDIFVFVSIDPDPVMTF